MLLYDVIDRGIKLSGVRNRRTEHEIAREELVQKTRALWSNALLVDETACLMQLGEQQPGMLRGLSVVLTMIATAIAFDHTAAHPDVRVIRGALSAITQALDAQGGSAFSVDLGRAVKVACTRAREASARVTDSAVEHAAHKMHDAVTESGGGH